jgi:catalase
MTMQQPTGRVSYEPNLLAKDSTRETPKGFRSCAASEIDERDRTRPEGFADHYSQSCCRYLENLRFRRRLY